MGILQHDAMTWQVRNGHFVCLEGLDMTGRITDEALHSWMAGLDSEARKTFVEVLYTVLEAARIELVTDFTDDWRERALKMLEALKEIDPETRRSVRLTLQSLFSAGASEVIKAVLPRGGPAGRAAGGEAQQSGRGAGVFAAGAALGGAAAPDPRLPAGNAGSGRQHGRLLRAGGLRGRSPLAGTGSPPESPRDLPRGAGALRRLSGPAAEGSKGRGHDRPASFHRSSGTGGLGRAHRLFRAAQREGKGLRRGNARQILPRARQLGMARVLVTCDENNPASEKVILKNGGVFDGVYMHDGVN